MAFVRPISNTLKEAINGDRETKTEVISLANHKGRRQSIKPIKTWNKYTGSPQIRLEYE